LIKEEDPKNSGKIMRNINENYLVLLIELILRISAGDSNIETKLSILVIEDMNKLTKRDLLFINKLLLPLIRNEDSLPVCLLGKDSSESWNPNLDSLICGR
jgi:hypothetical protein